VNTTTHRHIDFVLCKSIFYTRLRNKNQLPQYKKFLEWSAVNPTVSLIVNDGYCSLDQLNERIIASSQSATHYLYLAINKFYIYSTTNLSTDPALDYDSILVQHCYNLIQDQFNLVEVSTRTDDHGQLGNFVHPVTTLLLERRDKVRD
jgi:hypothetical protein